MLGLTLLLLLPIAALPIHAAATPATPPSPATSVAGQAAFQFALGKVLAAEGSFTEALAAFEEAEKLAPGDPYVRLERAELLGRLGTIARTPHARSDYLGKAVEEVKRARELAPGNPDVLRGVGEVYLALADQDPAALATAQEAYEGLRRRDPSDLQVMVTLGRIYLEQGQAGRAADVFRELVSYVPNNPTANSLLIESLLKADRKAEAEAVLKETLGFDPENLQARLTLAEVQGQRGDHRTALETLLAAPESVRGDPQLRRQLASALYLTGDLDAALKTADDLLKAQPDNQYLELLKGLILTAQGRNPEALALLSRLRDADPQDLVLTTTLARVLRRKGKKDEAAKLLTDLAADLAKDGKAQESRDAILELAQLYATTEDWAKVSETLAPLLHADEPKARTEALLLKADALIELKRFDEAVSLLTPVTATSPLLAAKRGEVLWKAGKERQAKRQLAQLGRSDDPQSLLAAAQSYQRLDPPRRWLPARRRLRPRPAPRPLGRRLPPGAQGRSRLPCRLELPGLHVGREGRAPGRGALPGQAGGGPGAGQRRLRRLAGLDPLSARPVRPRPRLSGAGGPSGAGGRHRPRAPGRRLRRPRPARQGP